MSCSQLYSNGLNINSLLAGFVGITKAMGRMIRSTMKWGSNVNQKRFPQLHSYWEPILTDTAHEYCGTEAKLQNQVLYYF